MREDSSTERMYGGFRAAELNALGQQRQKEWATIAEASRELLTLRWLLKHASWPEEPIRALGGMRRGQAEQLVEAFPGLRIEFNGKVIGQIPRPRA